MLNPYNKNLIPDTLNKSQITNCILEAPNGVATYSGSTITVKKGLKVLFANGRNPNETLKNLECTLQENIYTEAIALPTTPINCYFALYKDNGVYKASFWDRRHVFVSNTQPANLTYHNALWFNSQTNICKITSDTGATWHALICCLIGEGTVSPAGITSLNEYTPVELAKNTDYDFVPVMKWLQKDGVALSGMVEFDLSDILPAEPVYCFLSTGFTTTNAGYSELYGTSDLINNASVMMCSSYIATRTCCNGVIPTANKKLKFINPYTTAGIIAQYIHIYGYQKIKAGV